MSGSDNSDRRVAMLERKLERERRAREQAEELLETKSFELFEAKEASETDRRRLAASLEALQDGFAIVDKNLNLLLSNGTFATLFDIGDELTPGEQTLTNCLSGVSPDDFRWEDRVERGTGDPIGLAISSGATLEVTTRSSRVLSIRPGEMTDSGRPLIVRDITASRNLERQLANSQKQEALGTLAGGIAHEINTPTQYISDNVRFIQEGAADLISAVDALAAIAQDEASEILERFDVEFLREELPLASRQALEGAAQVAKIVAAVRVYSHPSSGVSETVDVQDLVNAAVTITRNEWKYVAGLKTDFSDDLPTVFGQPDGLRQVLLNLIVNASHALGGENGESPSELGTIKISATFDERYLTLVVEDSGPGIPEDIIERIFDPFFTTKAPGKGTGQGLSICRRIIEDDHGGKIAVGRSQLGGATFKISLPR